MKIVEIAFTGYPVTDMPRARAFYEDVLKLESTRTFESGDRHWTEYDLGPSTFAISNMSSEDWKPSNDGPAIALRSKISILPWPGCAQITIFDTVYEARRQTDCNATMIFVPAPFAADAICEK